MTDIDHNTLASLITLVGVLIGGGGLAAWFKARSDNRKTDAEAWQILYTTLADRVCTLEKKLDEKNALVETQASKIVELRQQIETLECESEAKDARIAALEEKVAVLEHRRKI